MLDMDIATKLSELGWALPEAPKPVGAYVPAVRIGNLLFVSGQLPMWKGKLIAEGKVPSEINIELARKAAAQCAVNALAMQGHIYYFGIPDDAIYPFPMVQFLRKNASLTSGLTRNRRAALSSANDYLKEHPELVAAYVTDQFKVENIQGAFDLAVRPAIGRLKVVINAGDWA